MMHYYPVYNIDKHITNIDLKKFWQVREIFSKNSLFKSLSVWPIFEGNLKITCLKYILNFI